MDRKPVTDDIREFRLGKLAHRVIRRTTGLTPAKYRLVKAWLTRQDVNLVTCNCDAREKWLDELGQRFINWFNATEN